MENTLSKKERLILANQYEILAKLAEDDYEKKQFNNLRDIFTSGYSRYYSLATEHFSDEVSDEECKFVVDVLNMYRDLYYSWYRNKDAHEVINEKTVLFKGFDLNDEIEVKYYSFYKFLVNDFGRFEEIKEFIAEGKIEDFNSHGSGPSMRQLNLMLSKWQEIKNRDEYNYSDDLALEEISEIINAHIDHAY
ncbi:YfbU family protein [Bacillus paramycoides]|uniref:YfbU family protein n=1 Tax=Bacillus paramycoides TaxID=2026194 RepID=UPI002E24B3A3|nr:YfbU family protein [Bacillus paramycoides]